MPVLRNLVVPLDTDDVVRAWGPRRARLATPAMRARIAGLLTDIAEQRLLEPMVSYRIRTVADHGPDWLELDGGIRIHSPLLSHRLRRASHLALGACTIGDGVPRRVSALFARNEPARAVMLDEIGSLALYRLADQFCAQMRDEARSMDLAASGVLNPGEEGFDLSQQVAVLRAAGGESIGVHVSGAALLLPQKSLTAVMGFGVNLPIWDRGENCGRCATRTRCPYRHDVVDGIAAA